MNCNSKTWLSATFSFYFLFPVCDKSSSNDTPLCSFQKVLIIHIGNAKERLGGGEVSAYEMGGDARRLA